MSKYNLCITAKGHLFTCIAYCMSLIYLLVWDSPRIAGPFETESCPRVVDDCWWSLDHYSLVIHPSMAVWLIKSLRFFSFHFLDKKYFTWNIIWLLNDLIIHWNYSSNFNSGKLRTHELSTSEFCIQNGSRDWSTDFKLYLDELN